VRFGRNDIALWGHECQGYMRRCEVPSGLASKGGVKTLLLEGEWEGAKKIFDVSDGLPS